MNRKQKVLEYLKEQSFSEKEFNSLLKEENYNAYDHSDLMSNIVNIYTNGYIGYDYISKEFDGYGQITYYSISFTYYIILSSSEDFYNCCSLDSLLDRIQTYKKEAESIEKVLTKKLKE